MERYRGPIEIQRVEAIVDIDEQATITTTYHLLNPTAQPLQSVVQSMRLGRTQLAFRRAGQTPVVLAVVPPTGPAGLARARVAAAIAAGSEAHIDERTIVRPTGGKTQTLTLTPGLELDGLSATDRIARYSATVLLPVGARKLVHSSLPPVRVDSVDVLGQQGLVGRERGGQPLERSHRQALE